MKPETKEAAKLVRKLFLDGKSAETTAEYIYAMIKKERNEKRLVMLRIAHGMAEHKMDIANCISTGNRKLKNGFLIWNIPAIITCPGSTCMCREKCYAKKAERPFQPQCLPSRMCNLQHTKDARFFENMVSAITRLSAGKNVFFRIHESGDFYNQRYLDCWFAIAYKFPNIRFLAFTKSFNLDFSDCPANIQIIASIWPDTDMSTVPAGWPRAYAGDCGDSNTIECPGQCDGCGMCWSLSTIGKNVHFNIH